MYSVSKRNHLSSLFHRGVAAAAIAGLAAGPGLAQQQAPAPTVQPVVPPAPVQLPALSPKQSAELARLLTDAGYEQGLRHDGASGPRLGSDEALVRATLDYARAVHSGRLDQSDFQQDWGLRPQPFDPLPGFADAVKRDRIAAWLRSLPPPYAGYDGLQKGLAKYRDIEAKGGWATLPAGPDLSVGATGARVTALRKRLAVEDSQVAATGATFDAALKEAVIRAQRRYGLRPTGTVSTGTLGALNVPVGDRVRQIMANMERWRWLPAEMPAKRIQVNIAAAVLTVFEGDEAIASMKAVTGRPGNETPMLQSRIHSVVLNPPWNVPTSIATKELFPKGAAYLARNNYKVIGTGPNRRLQQQPGPKTALGRYKFDFQNPYAVYLHDTPAQAAFSGFSRLESHGCVRLEKPGELAELLFRNDQNWQPEQINAALATEKTQRVQLQPQDQVSVYLLYWTAFAGGNGMNFRADPYSWDKKLASKIENRSAATAVASR
ncbi:L,D-transpeptidase family protein [Sphingomonas xinjiangensis]|uniref:Murein L,D-transpeptidase YcbB/YkuD n=1 Tax=Sphingomonas xinjiangensis TaxID=643568 RepID=A0A840YLW7_9SPHN|nr:L,D-transpeptidase family protein [Sphingomonas xinjiangensis]MBB5710586.1 murein L,D-transpeptidase YcbB/YkuD [Sphingomonas xinjiangensis]